MAVAARNSTLAREYARSDQAGPSMVVACEPNPTLIYLFICVRLVAFWLFDCTRARGTSASAADRRLPLRAELYELPPKVERKRSRFRVRLAATCGLFVLSLLAARSPPLRTPFAARAQYAAGSFAIVTPR